LPIQVDLLDRPEPVPPPVLATLGVGVYVFLKRFVRPVGPISSNYYSGQPAYLRLSLAIGRNKATVVPFIPQITESERFTGTANRLLGFQRVRALDFPSLRELDREAKIRTVVNILRGNTAENIRQSGNRGEAGRGNNSYLEGIEKSAIFFS
jgi:hypothetical protein